MAGGLVGLLDDVAALAKLAAASIDDVGAAAGRASVKAAGVVVDDTAVTPTYVQGLAAERELPIVKKIAIGSLRNKIVFILPAALLLSSIAPTLVEVILMCGGSFLAFEGAHKVMHALGRETHGKDHHEASVEIGPDAESKTVAGAIRTDFILSAEIMVIALKEVIEEPVVSRGVILVVVAVLITLLVYGVVGLIVKMDDIGLRLSQRESESARRVGRALVAGMPKLLSVLSTVGIAAMLWVGGHIIIAGFDELGWDAPYRLVHELEHALHDLAVVGPAFGWILATVASGIVGLVVGIFIATFVKLIPKRQPASSSGGLA